jgi:hypothetical protein
MPTVQSSNAGKKAAPVAAPASEPGFLKATFRGLFGGKVAQAAAEAVEKSPLAYLEDLSLGALQGSAGDPIRARAEIYRQWQTMLRDPVVGAALRIHASAALGGHESTGEIVFIEPKAKFLGDKQAEDDSAMVKDDLSGMFDAAAFPLVFNAIGYGDGYARMYYREREGIIGLNVDETMLPPLVQPYERAGATVAYAVAVGAKGRETLTTDQIARMKLPRSVYVAQPMAVEKAWRAAVTENDPEKHPLMPSLAGGSFLADVEKAHWAFMTALNGLTGLRALDTMDESMWVANVDGQTQEQKKEFMDSVVRMFKKSKELAGEVLSGRRSFLGKIRHILTVNSEKQFLQVQQMGASGGNSSRSGTITIDDVLFHAKILAGQLGVDLTMLGFADMLSGGLGDGGFIRTSIQSAERSRVIRVALSDALNHIARIHVLMKKGRWYEPGKEPWAIQFYGTISALEGERQRTAADAMNTGAVFVTVLTQLRDLAAGKEANEQFLSKVVKMDEDDAKVWAKALDAAAKKAAAEAEAMAGGGFGGGGGGAFGGGDPPVAPGATGSGDEE